MAGLSCGSQFAKYFLFAFNIIFWLVGATILGVGIWVLADSNALQLLHVATVESSDDLVQASAAVFVVVGAIVFITGFLGCCGAIRESPCMLLTYACLVGFILLLQIVAGILGVVFQDKIEAEIDNSINKTVQTYYGDPDKEGLTDAWDFIQREFTCCGALDGPSEWKTSAWQEDHTNETVPVTCCVLKNQKNVDETPEPENLELCYKAATNQTVEVNKYLWTEACKPSLLKWIKSHAATLIGIAFGLAIVQLIGIIIACVLHKKIKSMYEYV